MRTMLFGLVSRSRRVLEQLLRSASFDGGDQADGPESSVRVPRRRGPGNRGSAIALAEPDDAYTEVNAVGEAQTGQRTI
jgi:hypothetical protein